MNKNLVLSISLIFVCFRLENVLAQNENNIIDCYICKENCGSGPAENSATTCNVNNSIIISLEYQNYVKGLFEPNPILKNFTRKDENSIKPKAIVPRFMCYKVQGEVLGSGDKLAQYGCFDTLKSIPDFPIANLPSLDLCGHVEIDDNDGNFEVKGSVCLCNETGCNGSNSLIVMNSLVVVVGSFLFLLSLF